MSSCLIFDLDGTLIDSRLDLAQAVNAMRQSYGLTPLLPEFIVNFIGNGVHELVRRALAGTSIDIVEATGVMTKHYMNHLLDKTACYPGVRTGLAELSLSGFAIGVVTNKFESAARQILSKLDISRYISEVIGGDSGYPLKPAPDSFMAILQKFNADPDSSWVLGDHYTDLEAARRCGLRGAFAAYGFGSSREETFDVQIDNFTDFVQMVLLEKRQLN